MTNKDKKQWQAAFAVAERELRQQGKNYKKAQRKLWSSDLEVGKLAYAQQTYESDLTSFTEKALEEAIQAVKAAGDEAREYVQQMRQNTQASQEEEVEYCEGEVVDEDDLLY